jgi:hypothetical protein
MVFTRHFGPWSLLYRTLLTDLIVYFDDDQAAYLDIWMFITGYVVFLEDKVISWSSKG